MFSRRVRIVVFLSLGAIWPDQGLHAQAPAQRSIEIRLATGTELEKQGQAQLERVLATWDLSRWYFTHTVQIQSWSAPHFS